MARHALFDSESTSGLSEVLSLFFLCLEGTIVLILPPAMALSILGPAALRRVKADVTGAHPLSARERSVAIALLLILVFGVTFSHWLLLGRSTVSDRLVYAVSL